MNAAPDLDRRRTLRRRWLILLAIILAVLTADQVTKRYIVDNVAVGESRRVIPALYPLFQITHSQNTGSAFGFLPQAGDMFLMIAVVVVIGMVIFFPRIPDAAGLTRVATALICGGALGNAANRLEYGHVVDFIHYQIPGLISNVSNLADHAIVFGVGLMFLDSWRLERRKQRAQVAEAAAETPDSV